MKNPRAKIDAAGDPDELLLRLAQVTKEANAIRDKLKAALGASLGGTR